MSNTSATGGFLELSPGRAVYALEDLLHDLIAGITGLPGELVRPRWQPDPPEVPEPDVNWCAFGITQFTPSNLPVVSHSAAGEGVGVIIDTEELQVALSFYGPLHMDHARAFRRGIYVPQNREILRPAGLAFVRAGTIVPLPEQVALGWRARADVPLTFRLETTSTFATLTVRGTSGSITSDTSGSAENDGITVPIGCNACSRKCGQIQE